MMKSNKIIKNKPKNGTFHDPFGGWFGPTVILHYLASVLQALQFLLLKLCLTLLTDSVRLTPFLHTALLLL